MVTEANEKATAKAVVPPTTTAFLNLSAYMYGSYNTPYSSTPLQASIGFKPLLKNGKPLIMVDNKNGIYAEAFVSTDLTNRQVILGFEGTHSYFQGNEFTAGQLIDDFQLYGGKKVDFFGHTAKFTRQVIAIAGNRGITKQNVFVTGHSLGAAEAEYAAAKTGLGGIAFAGPGINVKYTHGRVPKIIDYVDAGDPVGNYAADGNNPLAPALVSTSIKHYGNLDVLQNADGLAGLQQAGQLYQKGLNDNNAREQQLAVFEAIANNGKYHEISQYASDLGVQLYINDSSAGADDDFFATGLQGGPAAAASISPVAEAAVCFCSGTRIQTVSGPTPVEQLRIGQTIVTHTRERRSIRWIGCRKHTSEAGTLPSNLWPVRIAANAFGPGVPVRDLFISPGHPVLVGANEDGEGGCLVPIMCLINGTTIERVPVSEATYWHIELDKHDILIAEGIPAESYIDLGSRPWFSGADGPLYDPDLALPEMAGRCRPTAIDGPIVEMERQRLSAAFAMRLSRACFWPSQEADALVW